MPSFDAVFAWLKEWQNLLAGLSTVMAACIFAIGTITAARIRAGGPRTGSSHRDLRKIAGPANDDPQPALSARSLSGQDMASNLDHLRWLIRTGLSPQLSRDVSQAGLIDCCKRIEQMELQNATLPENAAKTAQAQRKILLTDINALRELAENKAVTSDIISALIKLNASARALDVLLSVDATDRPGPASKSR